MTEPANNRWARFNGFYYPTIPYRERYWMFHPDDAVGDVERL